MITVELDNFSLREICRSGQCFRMHETAENNTYELVAGDKYLKISQAGSIVNFYCSDVEFICYWVPYFDIDSDYGRYIEKVNPRDTYLSAAVQCGKQEIPNIIPFRHRSSCPGRQKKNCGGLEWDTVPDISWRQREAFWREKFHWKNCIR